MSALAGFRAYFPSGNCAYPMRIHCLKGWSKPFLGGCGRGRLQARRQRAPRRAAARRRRPFKHFFRIEPKCMSQSPDRVSRPKKNLRWEPPSAGSQGSSSQNSNGKGAGALQRVIGTLGGRVPYPTARRPTMAKIGLGTPPS